MGTTRVSRARGRFRPITASVASTESNSDPNVTALWKFDEASGDIVDEINGVTLEDSGSPAYNVSASGEFAGISPGITYGTDNAIHLKNSATTELNIGTTHAVIEWFYKTTQSSGSPIMWQHNDEATVYGYNVQISFPGETVGFQFRATDGSALGLTTSTLPDNWNDGQIHKFRVVFNRTTPKLECFLDGVSIGSTADPTVNGKAVNAGLASFGRYPLAAAAPFVGTMYTWRLSVGADVLNNNLGGPGGG